MITNYLKETHMQERERDKSERFPVGYILLPCPEEENNTPNPIPERYEKRVHGNI